MVRDNDMQSVYSQFKRDQMRTKLKAQAGEEDVEVEVEATPGG